MSVPAAVGRAFPDQRFYEALGPVSLGELASLARAGLADASAAGTPIERVAPLDWADEASVTFCSNVEHASLLSATRAAACILPAKLADRLPESCHAVICELPQAAMAAMADRLHIARTSSGEGPPVHASALLEDGVEIGHGAVIAQNVQIGSGTRIGAGAVIGPGVCIGRGCTIGPRAVIGFALIGDRVRIHAGCVVGEPGFGAAAGPTGIVDLPQLGRVILQDGVTVGANSCIDRGAFADTIIGENTKIDNLAQIAHNVVIGRNCLLAAFTGISGSTVVGDGCIFGGRAGISDHITIGAGARIAAAAGVMKDVPSGESWGGSPARPVKRWMRETALVARLARRRMGDMS
ncbi:MAG TPA: UDP-3-O-(3-hydroxymyristoyl)glucosamine N-acyltransferase [Caulobacteraceae bacterium]|jgi:UDP-3-O-[3-hydroxymyristoyl] glucosamine N-acyltransferase|nr:UDP-3-O-(3-hydroxymyristoyl)glucosamine N-acyltransferase [Caulobacteraceae bacterium]